MEASEGRQAKEEKELPSESASHGAQCVGSETSCPSSLAKTLL